MLPDVAAYRAVVNAAAIPGTLAQGGEAGVGRFQPGA